MILRSANILCKSALEMGDATVDRLIDVIHSTSFDLSVFKGNTQPSRDGRELAQCERQWMIVASRCLSQTSLRRELRRKA